MSLPYPLKTPPPSSSALRTDNPGKTCRQSSGLSFRAPLYLLLRAVTAHVIFSASSEYWADLLLRFFFVLYSCLHWGHSILTGRSVSSSPSRTGAVSGLPSLHPRVSCAFSCCPNWPVFLLLHFSTSHIVLSPAVLPLCPRLDLRIDTRCSRRGY